MLYRNRKKKKLFHYIVEVAVAMSQLTWCSAASRILFNYYCSIFWSMMYWYSQILGRKQICVDCTVCWAHSTKVPGLAQIQRTQNVQDLHAAAACLFFSGRSFHLQRKQVHLRDRHSRGYSPCPMMEWIAVRLRHCQRCMFLPRSFQC